MGELMAEMGFRKDASNSVKEAFIKHLIRSAEGIHTATPSEKKEIEKNKIPQISEIRSNDKHGENCPEAAQLSFNFNEVS